MNEIPQPLISDDKPQRLAALEKELVLNSFKERGAALTEINRGELYKPTFATFEDYCQQRWDMTRSYAYRLIQAAAVAREMLPIGDIATESQARALLKVSAEQREAAFKRAIGRAELQARPLTARDISFGELSMSAKVERSTRPSVQQQLSKKEISIQDQLRALWANASPADRESFLAWTTAKSKPVVEEDGRFCCNSCGDTFADDSVAVTRYSCDNCGTEFSDEETGGNRCPDCNRFASVLTPLGCPNCDDGELKGTEGEKI